MHPMAVEPKLLRLDEAGVVLGVSHWTLRRWSKQGRLKTVKLGSLRLIPREEVDRLIRRGFNKKRVTPAREQRNGN